MGQPAFVGRTAELDVVAQAAHKAAAGEPSLLIVEAAAGIGKTALVRRAIEGLEGFSVWWASCDPAEQDWPFSVVEQWLRQADPRSEANSMVTDRGLGPHVPPVMVGARLVELLSTAQEVGPVIVVVDDVHWADEASLTAVGFMLRRLRADRVLVIATARTEAGAGAAVDGLEGAVPPARAAQWRRLARGTPRVRDLPLEGLPQQAVAQIVETAGVRGAASQALAKRLWELTGGHPLYLRSILAANTADTLIDQDAVVLVSASLEGAVRQMLARLPAPARAMAEALAVLDAPVPPAVAGTVAGLEGNPVQALEPLVAAGLVVRSWDEPSGPVRLAHPLQQAAVYRAIGPERRRELHMAAAPIVDLDSAWAHRVAACTHRDPALAEELEAEAARKAAAGYLDRAATLMLWAANLDEAREHRERCLLTAASYANHLLNPSGLAAARALRPAVESCAPCALRTVLLSCYSYLDNDYLQAVRLGERAVAEAEADADPHVMAAARFRLALSDLVTNNPARARELLARTLDDHAVRAADTAVSRWLLAMGALFAEGPRGVRAFPWMTGLPDDPGNVPLPDTMLLVSRGYTRLALGELHAAQGDFETVLHPVRAMGSPPLGRLHAQLSLGLCLYMLGDWDRAASYADQALVEGEIDGFNVHHAPAHTWTVFIAAGRGDWQSAHSHLATLRQRPVMPIHGDLPPLAEAAVAQARGDHTAMLDALRPAYRTAAADAGHPARAWPDLMFWPMWTEALIATGNLGEAESALTRLRTQTGMIPCLEPITTWCTGQLAEAHGDLDTALAAYHQQLDRSPGPDDPPLHRARLEHAAGQLHLLRMDHDRARRLIGQARNRCHRLGAHAFAAGR